MAPPAPDSPTGITREATRDLTDDAVGVTLPVGFRATSDDVGFKLVVHSRPKWAWFMTIFALLWNGFMVVWFTISIVTGAWLMALFGSIHGVIGIITAYTALRAVFNRLELSVSRGALEVRHRPFPWFAPPPIGRDDIAQLFVKEDRSMSVNDVPVVRYALHLGERSGKSRQLFIVEEKEQALYLEREVERAFGIDDVLVPGEVAKR